MMLATLRRVFVHLWNFGGCEMWNDPIVDELHAIRQQLAAECNNDLEAIVRRAMQRQQQHVRQLITQPPKSANDSTLSKL
jgi:hypothetical protein